jgi:phenylacetate-CoA ligase
MINYNFIKKINSNIPDSIFMTIRIISDLFPRDVLLGSGFRKMYKYLMESQFFTKEEMRKHQEKQLQKLIIHAYDNVKYYNEIFNKYKINPYKIKKKEDLREIPFLTKDIVRNRFKDLRAKNYKKFYPGLAFTSGTTGESLAFLLDQKNREIEYASTWRQLTWAGIGFKDKICTFRGDFVNDLKCDRIYKYDAIKKEYSFNSYCLKSNKIDKMIRIVKKLKPALIKGYPSVLNHISDHMRKQGIRVNGINAIQTSSEMLLNDQRNEIENAFGARIFDWYSSSEYVTSAGNCDNNEGLHICDETSIVDFRKDGNFYEMIGTGLYNFSMPFINYKSEDYTSDMPTMCRCGRGLSIIPNIIGRNSEIIYTEKDTVITPSTFIHYWKHEVLSKLDVKFKYIQLIQKKIDVYELNYVLDKELNAQNKKKIMKYLKKLLGEGITIYYCEIDSIPLNSKWQCIKSEIDKDRS